MEVASRIFDVITNPQNLRPEIAELLPEITDPNKKSYWRQVLRAAALCHDIGHLPFSHVAERTRVDFPVLDLEGRIISAFALSNVLKNLPPLTVNCIFIEPELQKEAIGWLKKNRHDIIKNQ
jgi:HD superfamily phosphohydrolase